MQVEHRTGRGTILESEETRLLLERIVFIQGEIDSTAASEFFRKIMLLNLDSQEPIRVCINSIGGELTAGMLMYDAIQGSRAPVRMICTGMAYSMAAILFACGRQGRYMLPHSELMLHEPLLGGRVGGSSSAIRSISESLLKSRDMVNGLLSDRLGKPLEEVEKAASYDHYFTAEESLEFGLCDEILTFDRLLEV